MKRLIMVGALVGGVAPDRHDGPRRTAPDGRPYADGRPGWPARATLRPAVDDGPRHDGHSHMMCQMMPQMLGAQMDSLGIGMKSGDQVDPKMMARMLQLRGDMLKAMGEVLLKHGKAMEEAQ